MAAARPIPKLRQNNGTTATESSTSASLYGSIGAPFVVPIHPVRLCCFLGPWIGKCSLQGASSNVHFPRAVLAQRSGVRHDRPLRRSRSFCQRDPASERRRPARSLAAESLSHLAH